MTLALSYVACYDVAIERESGAFGSTQQQITPPPPFPPRPHFERGWGVVLEGRLKD